MALLLADSWPAAALRLAEFRLAELPVAVAVGPWRPTIVLPRHAVDRSSREDLRLMLAHEWAHVRAGDLWLLAALRLAAVASLVSLSPDHADLLCHRAMILGRAGREAEAIAAYEACLEAPPRFAFLIRNNLAHLLATAKDASLRDPERAVELATEAVATAERPMAQFYDTLAEAHAAAGDFGPAAEAQQKAVNLALGPERAGFAAKLEAYEASRLPNAAP